MSNENLSNDIISKYSEAIDTQNIEACMAFMNDIYDILIHQKNRLMILENENILMKNEQIIMKNEQLIMKNEIANIINKWLFVNEKDILTLLQNYNKFVAENNDKSVIAEKNNKTIELLQEQINTLKIKKTNGKISINEPKFPKIDKNNETYKLALRFLNDLLKSMNKAEIVDITGFTDISRKDLLKIQHNEIVEKYRDEIIKIFGKSKSQYYRKSIYHCYSLTLIKMFASKCGYKFGKKEVHKWDVASTMSYNEKCDILYSIIA